VVVRPRDAATLILLRHERQQVRVLMGRRASGHSFMPDKYVFPGGKVDRGDRFVPSLDELSDQTAIDLGKPRLVRHPRAFALAAIRETFEETGLIIGAARKTRYKGQDKGWIRFFNAGATPHLTPLIYIGRAITPPTRHKRFDARFFMADAANALMDERPACDGTEMLDLRWFSFEEASGLDLPNVTRFILGEIEARIKAPDAHHRPPFLRWTNSGHKMDRL
jgi:8-oxo-dGTP pyrophosphatase MutT (NUDIX family)